ncbi:MAG TPA: hypothetical protein VM183_16505, partial [Burkholderiales bacterium]|nr:hypothetical protein [Burkholderiales bacterium]
MRLALVVLLLASSSAFAQYQGPAVEACRAFALKELKSSDAVIDRDRSLLIERYTRKVGNQFVSSVLTGNGAVVYADAPSAELSFVCLLADEKRPVFFHWLPRAEVSSFAQCTRSESLRAKPRPCLDTLLKVAEDDLGQLYAQGFQDANERGEAALGVYRKTNEDWRRYRDAECARREGDERRLACT